MMRKVTLAWLTVLVLNVTAASVAAQPDVVGQWNRLQDLPFWAPHAHLLPTGKVLIWPGFFAAEGLPRLWDPVTESVTAPASPGSNVFCSGHTFLADGRLLVVGGHMDDNVGLPNARAYEPFGDTWTSLPNMADARWYPTTTTLGNGDVVTVSGDVDHTIGVNRLPEVYEAGSASWRPLTNALLALDLYPRMFLAPNGKVFNVAPSEVTRYLDTSGTGAWTVVANRNSGNRDYASAVMYADGKVLVVGGGDPPTAAAEVIDLNEASPTWRTVAPMAVARRHLNATLLPDGKVLVTGGTSGPGFNNANTPVYAAEIWDPASETWSTMASAQIQRRYHSTALLLPDGRVLTTGGNSVPQVEVYSPPYLFKGPRPTITLVPTTAGHGQTIFVQTPDAASIAQVTWIRLGSVTHAFNQNQRINRLSFSQASGGLNVVTPSSGNVAPPGHYMLFIVNSDGVPSVAAFVRVAVSTTDTTAPTVALSGPTAGTTVSGTVTVSANASDNVGVVGVQFFLDGSALGPEDMTAPYSYSWATTGTSNGTHALTARARDAAGNETISAGVNVTVSNSGPVAAYALDAASGTVATDASGSGYHGTLVNAPAWVAGHTGNALSFDGVNKYVQIPNLPHLPQWTISAWVRSPTAPASFSAADSGPIHREKNFQINWNHSNAAFRGAAAVRVGVTWYAASFGALAANTWYYLVATYDGENLRAYTNAALMTTNAAPSGPAVAETGPLRLAAHALKAQFFKGLVDDVRIYNRALSLSEIDRDMRTPVGGTAPPPPAPPPSDTTPPTVALTAPAGGATVSGTVTLSATASDNVGVAGVQFFVDGNLLGEDTVTPYSYSWDATAATPGNHDLTAKARDGSGNTTTSSAVTVTVVAPPDTTPPTVALTAPAAGATVSGTVTVSANASDNVGVGGVQFLLDGQDVGAEDTAAPYSYSWNTTGVSEGSHALSARARDAAGNVTTSTAVTVTVDNTAPTVALTEPATDPVSGTVTVSGAVTVSANANDNIGVVGVQFLLDDNALGPEDTTAPYSYSWATTGTSNGTHTLTARARDAAGNVTTSAGVNVTVSNAAPVGPPPIAAYSSDAGSGTVATDASGSGYHGTLVNGPAWVAGHTGSALSFDGVNDYVQIATLPHLPQWTISAWVRSPAAPASFSQADSGPIHREKNFQINWNHSNAAFRSAAALRVGVTWYAASFGALAANTWYYLVATYDGETLRAYTNGALVTSNAAPSGPATAESSPLRLGAHAAKPQFFRGTIDDVRIYNRALSLSEIQQDMQTPVGP